MSVSRKAASDIHQPPAEQSVIASWCAVLAEALESYRIDGARVFKQAGVDLSDIQSPNARISTRQLDDVWRLSLDATKDEAFALEVGRRLHPGTLHALGFALFASSTLEEGFRRLSRYVRLLSQLTHVDVAVVRDEIHLIVVPLDQHILPARILGFASAMVKIWREIYRPDFNPKWVRLGRLPPPQSAQARERIHQYFCCPVTYEAEDIRLAFSLHDARQTLPAANAELARRSDEITQEYLAQLDRSAWAPLVIAELIRQLPSGNLDKTVIAAKLGMGARTLQRRLSAEGVSYRQLIDDTRRGLAQRYVIERRRSLKEIAFLLGYSDLSNFTRAFRGWFGVPPRKFQQEK